MTLLALYGCIYFVCFVEDNETSEDFGISLAAKFTNYTIQSDAFIGTKNKFIYHKDETLVDKKPVNYYLRDRDTLLRQKRFMEATVSRRLTLKMTPKFLGSCSKTSNKAYNYVQCLLKTSGNIWLLESILHTTSVAYHCLTPQLRPSAQVLYSNLFNKFDTCFTYCLEQSKD